jgi:uncharacterized protein (TIGR03067 family)
VTDAGLSDLKVLNNLQALYLFGTAVTDAGLQELGKLKSLRSLDLFGTRVTVAGLKKLQQALPGTQISGLQQPPSPSAGSKAGVWTAPDLQAFAPPKSKTSDPKGDIARLQGKWQVVANISNGLCFVEPRSAFSVWTISGNKVMYGGEREDVLRLGPAHSPGAMDIDIVQSGKVTMKGIPAIYVVDGNTLVVCVGTEGGPRPTAFETVGHPGQRLLILRRLTE